MDLTAPARIDVALITMPFGGLHTPSLALSLLRSELERAGISTTVHYLNLSLAERIGVEQYDRYAEDLSGAFLGEWLFSDCLAPRPPEEGERFVEEVLIPLRRFTLEDIEGFERDRAIAGPFLEECLRAEDWSRYRIVGFTSTFHQNTASLAFARLLKRSHPALTIVFGGANCEGEMGIQLRRSFPWIDFVCTGEGDDVFPDLARQILGRRAPEPLPGIAGARHEPCMPAKVVTNLDRLPIPDVSGYFDRLAGSPIQEGLLCRLLIETSRGCWWGEKHHCTFCGLNGLTMRFRSKSPDRALDEITRLASRYRERLDPTCSISLADNILDMKYMTTLLPALRDAGLGVSLFYETKANLHKEQVRLLAEAGVREIQPGIESLHSALLRLMSKGCTALQNLQLLRWCREFGVTPHWSILFGFPGEQPEWFGEQVRTVARIHHLAPPGGVCPVRLDRFSPYFVDPRAHGISAIRPARALTHIYALPADELARLAYHFDFDFDDGRSPASYIGPLADAVGEWRAEGGDRFFYAFRRNDRLLLWDGRGVDPGEIHALPAGHARLYEFCDKVRGHAEALAFAEKDAGLTASAASRLLDDWKDAGWILEDEGRVLALAVFAGAPADAFIEAGAVAPAGRAPSRAPAEPDRLWSRRPRRPRTLRAVEMNDELILLDRDRGRVLILDPTAARIMARCDGERTVAAIAEEGTGAGARARDRDRKEAVRVIQLLEDEGLLESERPPVPGSRLEPDGRTLRRADRSDR